MRDEVTVAVKDMGFVLHNKETASNRKGRPEVLVFETKPFHRCGAKGI